MIDYNKELKDAMISADSLKLSVIRCLKTEVSKLLSMKGRNGKELTQDEEWSIIRKEVKKREESIALFTRVDAIEKEEAEKQVLLSFLPASISVDELNAIIDHTISELGATSRKDIGKVIAGLNSIPQLVGAFDPKEASRIISSKLA